jgi:hypothetical protein
VTVVSLARVFISYLVHPLYLTEANSSDPRTNRVAPAVGPSSGTDVPCSSAEGGGASGS